MVKTSGSTGSSLAFVCAVKGYAFKDEQVARETSRQMAQQEGIFAGTSSGLNVAGAIQIAKELGTGHDVVTVAVDSGLKYLAGDLYV